MGLSNTVFFASQEQTPELLREFPALDMFGIEHQISAVHVMPHTHPGIELFFTVEGIYDWFLDGKRFTVPKNSGFVANPWQRHWPPEEILGPGRHAWLQIVPEQITPDGELKLGSWSTLSKDEEREVGRRLAGGGPFGMVPEMRGLLWELFCELTERKTAYRSRVYRLLTDALILAARHPGDDVAERKISDGVHRAILAMQNEPGKDWPVAEMAALAGLGERAFRKQVLEYTGFAPHQYLVSLRIERAMEFLRKTELSVTDIAHHLGFSSSQHLNRAFKKHTGLTPLDYRRRGQD